jgi:hypothetical protein
VGVPAGWPAAGGVVVVSVLAGLFLAVAARTRGAEVVAAWPRELPLLPAALGAGLLGALACGDEARDPLRAMSRGSTQRRLGVLAAKLLVAALIGVLLALVAPAADAVLLHVLDGAGGFGAVPVPAGRSGSPGGDWTGPTANCLLLTVGCAWAGVLAAAAFRSTVVGFAGALTVPFAVVPLLHGTGAGPAAREAGGAGGIPGRLPGVATPHGVWGAQSGGAGSGVVQMVTQPVGTALMLSLVALFCAFLLLRFRGKAR